MVLVSKRTPERSRMNVTSQSKETIIAPFSWWICLVVALGVFGCSSAANNGPKGPPPHPVTGKVFYKGKPADGFAVAFHPVTAWDGAQFAPSGMTDANGDFQLHSYGENDGAPAGEYKVTFTWPKEIAGPDPDEGKQVVDQLRGAYSNPQRSKFTVKVVEGENELPPFELK